MLFENVVIAGLAHVDAPIRVTSAELEDRLLPVCKRLGLPTTMLRTMAGIEARRWWPEGVQPSDGATLAAEKVLAQTGIPRERLGLIINSSVSRDFIEPSTACLVHSNLKLSSTCLNFDLGNACLGFVNAMSMAGALLERGLLDYALIVDCESSRVVQTKTIERMLSPQMDAEGYGRQFATLTLGSGAAAMILTRRALHDGPRFRGGVDRANTQYARLCRGQVDQMETEAGPLLKAGVQLALETYAQAGELLGWHGGVLDELVLHQVSAVHTRKLCDALKLDINKALLTFPEFGNIGPAAIPITLSKAVEMGRIKPGDRVGMMAIGSGLNCTMAEIEWA